MPTQIRNACILTPFAQQDGVVIVEGGRITGVARNADIGRGTKIIDAHGMYLVPGYVDIHAHGGGSGRVMDGTPESILAMCESHALCGTTTIVPTTRTGPPAEIERALHGVRIAKSKLKAPTIAGAHVQGLFCQPSLGGSTKSTAVPIEEAEWKPFLDRHKDIRIVGVSPELPGALALGDALREKGIVATIAQSRADYEQVLTAVSHGFSDITNLYTGNSVMYQKGTFHVPGVSECGLVMDELTVQVVADGWQLPLLVLQVIFRCKGAENMMLVSDAGSERTPADRFEEGFSTMALAVRNMVATGVSLRVALRMATVNPARRIGLDHTKGRIAVGYDADILLLDDALNVRFCMANGKVLRNDLAEAKEVAGQ